PTYSSVDKQQEDVYYWVAGYAQIQLLSYDFSGDPKTITFKYKGAAACDLLSPGRPGPPLLDTYVVNEDTVLSINAPGGVLANDPTIPGHTLNAILVRNGTHGDVVLNADGS